MAENGNVINNNSEEPRTTTFENQRDRSEFDATHVRLRTDVQPAEKITCLSCDQKFSATSLLQIYEHYAERVHQQFYANCLYCQGKVHRYFHSGKQGVQTYHDCLRCKRGEDK